MSRQKEAMITVIIPAHNAEQTIERAIDSIARELPESEVLVIENGSSDGTVKTVQNLAEKPPLLRLLTSEKGVSNARNKGLSEARGEWILFLDADDRLSEGSGRVLRACVEQAPVDLRLFGHFSGTQTRSVTDGEQEQRYLQTDVENARVQMISDPTRYMQVWAKLFRASLIRKHDLRFNEKLTLSEDSDFTLRYSAFCQSIVFSPESIYCYSLDSASVMRTADGTKVKTYTEAMEETKKSIKHETEAIKKAFHKYVLMHLNIAMVREVFAAENRASGSERKTCLKNTVAEPIFREALLETKGKECFSLRMLPALLLKLHFFSLAALLFRIRAKQNARREG